MVNVTARSSGIVGVRPFVELVGGRSRIVGDEGAGRVEPAYQVVSRVLPAVLDETVGHLPGEQGTLRVTVWEVRHLQERLEVVADG